MFTFIRIHLPILRTDQVDRLRAARSKKGDEPEPEAVANPWKGELDRLQRGMRSETDQVHFGVTPGRTKEPAPPPPPPLPPPPQVKRGTLTDLKIWWGKATVYKTPAPHELNRFAPVPPKKRNRWLQF